MIIALCGEEPRETGTLLKSVLLHTECFFLFAFVKFRCYNHLIMKPVFFGGAYDYTRPEI